MDYDYRVIARRSNITINDKSSDDIAHFPIEKARLRSIWYVIGTTAISMVGYGWVLESRVVSSSTYHAHHYITSLNHRNRI